VTSVHLARSRASRGGSPEGFGLAEILVATAIVLVIAAGLLEIAAPASVGFGREQAANDVQDRLRAAADVLRQQLLEAGSGPGFALAGLPLGLVVPAVLPCRVGRRQADPPGTFRDDAISIVAGLPSSAAAAIAADFQGSAGRVPLSAVPGCPVGSPACGLEAGADVLLLASSGRWDRFGIVAVEGASVTLVGRGAVTGRRYAAGSWLIPVAFATYYLRPGSGADGPQLARYDGNESDLPFVDHLVRLAFEYYGDPQPPRLRAQPGALGDVMTYGPSPPPPGVDDDQDAWGPGENCVVAAGAPGRLPRLTDLGPPQSPLRRLTAESLADGPWCPDATAANRFDADLLRIRKVRVTLRAEAWHEARRGADPRFFARPGSSPGGGRSVADGQVTFDVVLRTPGGSR
jgi:type II secretory pathway pseudopilin PulG